MSFSCKTFVLTNMLETMELFCLQINTTVDLDLTVTKSRHAADLKSHMGS